MKQRFFFCAGISALETMQELVRDFDGDRSKLHLQTAELVSLPFSAGQE
jgi:hypothetical protein